MIYLQVWSFLTVLTLTTTHLKTLDKFVDQYTKKWSGVQKRATNALIHISHGIDMPSISTLYTEAHNTAHPRTTLQYVMIVNNVMNQTFLCEATLTRSQDTTTQAEKVYRETLNHNTVAGEVP